VEPRFESRCSPKAIRRGKMKNKEEERTTKKKAELEKEEK
jgi:hypothetical protein